MDRAKCLAKLDQKHHAVADAMAAAGINWSAIFALLIKILPDILDLFKQPMAAAAPGHKCPADAATHLCEARESQLTALCKVLCAEHCLGCDE